MFLDDLEPKAVITSHGRSVERPSKRLAYGGKLNYKPLGRFVQLEENKFTKNLKKTFRGRVLRINPGRILVTRSV